MGGLASAYSRPLTARWRAIAHLKLTQQAAARVAAPPQNASMPTTPYRPTAVQSGLPALLPDHAPGALPNTHVNPYLDGFSRPITA